MPGTKASEAIRREQILDAAYHVAALHGLQGMRIQEVAERAGVSHGLVLFYFKSKRGLLLALLDWLLATTTVLHLRPEIERRTAPSERLLALLHQEMDRLASEPQRIRLTFDFWTAGIRDAEIRSRIRTEFERYRVAFKPLVTAVISGDPARFQGVTAEGLAAVSVSLIQGCAVQAMIDPEHFDLGRFLTAAESLLEPMLLGGVT
jgi:AcrR family transcriptional regulator